MPRVVSNGLEFEVESFGDERHPAVLLIMGLGMQLTAWPEAFCRELVAAGYRVIRFDNRDIGLSSAFPTRERPNLALQTMRYLLRLPVRAPYRIDDMARDAAGVLDALGIERAHLVGASMGGMIAQNLAAQFPQRCLSLTSIMSSSGNRRLPTARPRVMRMMLARLPSGTDFEILVDHYVRLFQALGGPRYRGAPGELRERLERSLRRSYHPAGTLRQLLSVVASGDRSELLRRITAPTLVIHGDADPLVPLAHGKDCARKIPRAALRVIEGMGHDLPTALLPVLAQAVVTHFAESGRAGVRGA